MYFAYFIDSHLRVLSLESFAFTHPTFLSLAYVAFSLPFVLAPFDLCSISLDSLTSVPLSFRFSISLTFHSTSVDFSFMFVEGRRKDRESCDDRALRRKDDPVQPLRDGRIVSGGAVAFVHAVGSAHSPLGASPSGSLALAPVNATMYIDSFRLFLHAYNLQRCSEMVINSTFSMRSLPRSLIQTLGHGRIIG